MIIEEKQGEWPGIMVMGYCAHIGKFGHFKRCFMFKTLTDSSWDKSGTKTLTNRNEPVMAEGSLGSGSKRSVTKDVTYAAVRRPSK